MKALEPKEDRIANGFGQPEVGELLAPPALFGLKDVAPVERLLQELLEHERIALAALVQEWPGVGLGRVIEDRLHHSRHRSGVERFQLDHLGEAAPAPALDVRQERVFAADLLGPERSQHQYARAGEAAGEEVQQLPCRSVRPVKVLDHEQQAGLRRDDLEQMQDRLEESELGLARITCFRGRGSEPGEEIAELRGGSAEALAQRRQVSARDVVSERLEEGKVWQRKRRVRAAAAQVSGPDPTRALSELGRQSGLAHAGIPGQQQHPAFAANRRQQCILELGQLRFAADEHRAQGPNHGHDAANASRLWPR